MSVKNCKDGFIVFIILYGYPFTLAKQKTLLARVGAFFLPQSLPRGERPRRAGLDSVQHVQTQPPIVLKAEQ